MAKRGRPRKYANEEEKKEAGRIAARESMRRKRGKTAGPEDWEAPDCPEIVAKDPHGLLKIDDTVVDKGYTVIEEDFLPEDNKEDWE